MIFFNEQPLFWPRVLGVDLETTGLDPHSGRILSIQLSDGVDTFIFLHIHGFKKVLKVLQDPKVLKIFHAASFDVMWINSHLHIPVNNVYCTMLAEQVIDGGRSEIRDVHNKLQDVLASRLGIMIEKETQSTFIDHPGFRVQPITDKQIEYMANDVIHLPKLREAQLAEINRDGLLPTDQLENDCISAFADLEYNGMRMNIDLWYEYAQWYTDQIEVCNQKMRDTIGDFVLQVPRRVKKQDVIKDIPSDKINFNSSDQIKHLLQQHYGLHVPNTDAKKTLRPILNGEILANVVTKESLNFISILMERRTWEKYLGWNYPKHINATTGKIHPRYKQIGADTGRVSCSNPGMHQVPRPVIKENPDFTSLDWKDIYSEPNLRHLFIPDNDDMVLARVDYSQQEPRIFAHICGDPALIKACNEEDVYLAQAELLFGHPVAKDSEERQITKSFVLAKGYGAGNDTLHRSSGRPIEDCARIANNIEKSFPIMTNHAKKADAFLRRNGFMTTVLGRRRYIKQNKRQYAQSVNTPVQGSGADMFKLAFKKVFQLLTNMKNDGIIDSNTRVWHVMHDELVIQCAETEIDIVIPAVKNMMEEAGKELCPSVRHLAEFKISKTWDK